MMMTPRQMVLGEVVLNLLWSHSQSRFVVFSDGRNGFRFKARVDIDVGSEKDVVFHLLEKERMDRPHPIFA